MGTQNWLSVRIAFVVDVFTHHLRSCGPDDQARINRFFAALGMTP